MNDILLIDNYHPAPQDKFIFDTNIWMYICFPLGDYQKELAKIYTGFLKKSINAKAEVVITSLILSELFNCYVKLEFSNLKKLEPDKFKDYKKDFRNSDKYQDIVSDLNHIINSQVLKLSHIMNDGFDEIDIDLLFVKPNFSYDFNDICLQEVSSLRGLKIVTHDSDFIFYKGKVPIITANQKLLQAN